MKRSIIALNEECCYA